MPAQNCANFTWMKQGSVLPLIEKQFLKDLHNLKVIQLG